MAENLADRVRCDGKGDADGAPHLLYLYTIDQSTGVSTQSLSDATKPCGYIHPDVKVPGVGGIRQAFLPRSASARRACAMWWDHGPCFPFRRK